jgi:hypothetical protein
MDKGFENIRMKISKNKAPNAAIIPQKKDWSIFIKSIKNKG